MASHADSRDVSGLPIERTAAVPWKVIAKRENMFLNEHPILSKGRLDANLDARLESESSGFGSADPGLGFLLRLS